MTRLLRFTQKLFGNTAPTNTMSKFGSFAAGSPARYSGSAITPALIQSLSEFSQGWTSATLAGGAPAVEDMNSLFYCAFYQLSEIFQDGVPVWDSGTTYYTGSIVNNAGVLYVSIVDANTGNAVSNLSYWNPLSSEYTGIGKDYWGTSLPSGYVYGSGLTIGNASSNATERANADTFALFTLLWSNTTLQMYNSSGGTIAHGASAAADFAANNALSLPDCRGRARAGRDDMGGTPANRLTSAGSGINGIMIGASGGAETHTLLVAEVPSLTYSGTTSGESVTHTHGFDSGHSVAVNDFVSSGGLNLSGGSTNKAIAATDANSVDHTHTYSGSTSGGGGAHQNTQPTIVCNYIIKL